VDKSTHRADYSFLSNLLREIREQAGLRQVDVADRMGEPQSFVSKYETGERRLDLVELAGVCQAIGIGLGEFVARFDDRVREPGTQGRSG
jgi:transcriptional regulator with XRE-family HTH domain